jgi:hypothetical protein
MKNYTEPTVIEYGESTELIKGDCGWGVENVWLDKTGYYSGTDPNGNYVCSPEP